MPQTSLTFNQVKWFGVGDVDDCWVVSSIQLVHAITPWVYLVGTKAFRAAAGDPDDGNNDGGNLNEILKGITGCYPDYAGKLTPIRGSAIYSSLTSKVDAGSPASVAVISGKLPLRLRHGFTGAHQVTIARRNNGLLAIADPLAPIYSRWEDTTWTELKPAIMEYGKVRSGTASVYAVVGPREVEMLHTHPMFVAACNAASSDLIAAANKQGYNAGIAAATEIAGKSAADIAALKKA